MLRWPHWKVSRVWLRLLLMAKVIRRVAAVLTLLAMAVKGVWAFLSWVEKQEPVETSWADDEEMEEAF